MALINPQDGNNRYPRAVREIITPQFWIVISFFSLPAFGSLFRVYFSVNLIGGKKRQKRMPKDQR